MRINNDLVKRVLFAILGVGLMAYGFGLQSGEPTAGTDAQVRKAASAGSASSGPALVKVPIKDLRVGTRVPAFNPEVSAGERRGFTEPNWYRWMKLRLEMPKPDGTLLEIEMLRSEDWLIHNVALVVESQPVMLAGASEVSEFTGKSTLVGPGVPLRAIYGHLVELFLEAAVDGDGVSGLVVELDLPELGLSGPAWIVDLEPAPIVPAGPGQVVTATFKHASASVLDLVLASTPPATQSSQPAINSSPSAPSISPTDTIGVTANHPFWSVDRAEFVQAGELRIGERLQTLTGDIQWVQQKLPRPGPEPVYNLEVHDEHVYYVGSSGVLVHNSYPKPYGTPYRQLSRARLDELEAKAANRTITKAEWKHLQWQRRLIDRRQAGVRAFWERERLA